MNTDLKPGIARKYLNSRHAAADIVSRWLIDGDFPDRIMESEPVEDRAFVMEVVYGVVRWRRRLEWVVGRLSERRPDDEVRPFLLIGLYQILHMDSVADHAAVNETVAAVKAAGLERASGFTNAVLRKSLREKDVLERSMAVLPLAIRESHPDILVKGWIERFGESQTEELCRWNNSRPRVTLRPDPGKVSLDDFLIALRKAGFKAAPHPFAPDRFLVLGHGARVQDLPGYSEGLFIVHDPATCVAVDLLDPQPGEVVLDACAAPGGKTVMIAGLMRDSGEVVAMDLHADRIAFLRENIQRMGLKCVRTAKGDAADRTAIERLGVDGFDRILLDVPCSNTGVLRRRPDARWRFKPARLRAMLKTQRAILDACAPLLKPGGLLVYSTCSLEQDENEMIVRGWLEDNVDFRLDRDTAIFPPTSATDGVYAARLIRTDN